MNVEEVRLVLPELPRGQACEAGMAPWTTG